MRGLTEPFQLLYMQRALAVMLILSVLGGTVGVAVQLRRLAFLTDTVTHTVFPGVAIAFFTGRSLLLGALAAGVVSVVVLTLAARDRRIDTDAFLALVLASFFSIGVLVVSRGRTFSADLTALLFGRVLAVRPSDLVITAAITAVALVTLVALRKELVLRAFDPEAAAAFGYPVFWLDLVVNLVVMLVVVAAVRAVGTALVVALLITPAATARLLCNRIGSMVLTSCAVAALASWVGLSISYEASIRHDVRLAPGATIVVVLTALFVVVGIGVAVARVVRRQVVRRERALTATVAP